MSPDKLPKLSIRKAIQDLNIYKDFKTSKTQLSDERVRKATEEIFGKNTPPSPQAIEGLKDRVTDRNMFQKFFDWILGNTQEVLQQTITDVKMLMKDEPPSPREPSSQLTSSDLTTLPIIRNKKVLVTAKILREELSSLQDLYISMIPRKASLTKDQITNGIAALRNIKDLLKSPEDKQKVDDFITSLQEKSTLSAQDLELFLNKFKKIDQEDLKKGLAPLRELYDALVSYKPTLTKEQIEKGVASLRKIQDLLESAEDKQKAKDLIISLKNQAMVPLEDLELFLNSQFKKADEKADKEAFALKRSIESSFLKTAKERITQVTEEVFSNALESQGTQESAKAQTAKAVQEALSKLLPQIDQLREEILEKLLENVPPEKKQSLRKALEASPEIQSTIEIAIELAAKKTTETITNLGAKTLLLIEAEKAIADQEKKLKDDSYIPSKKELAEMEILSKRLLNEIENAAEEHNLLSQMRSIGGPLKDRVDSSIRKMKSKLLEAKQQALQKTQPLLQELNAAKIALDIKEDEGDIEHPRSLKDLQDAIQILRGMPTSIQDLQEKLTKYRKPLKDLGIDVEEDEFKKLTDEYFENLKEKAKTDLSTAEQLISLLQEEEPARRLIAEMQHRVSETLSDTKEARKFRLQRLNLILTQLNNIRESRNRRDRKFKLQQLIGTRKNTTWEKLFEPINLDDLSAMVIRAIRDLR